MPYIKGEDRVRIGRENGYKTPGSLGRLATNSGELNFVLSLIIRDYFESHGDNYAAANDVIGALEGAKLEFYRRVVAPYEDQKIATNGDVYFGGRTNK